MKQKLEIQKTRIKHNDDTMNEHNSRTDEVNRQNCAAFLIIITTCQGNNTETKVGRTPSRSDHRSDRDGVGHLNA